MPEGGKSSEKIFKILLVDDEEEQLNALSSTLKRNKRFKCEIVTAGSGEEALVEVKKQNFDLVLSDYVMSGITGVDLLTKVREKNPRTIRMLITAYSDLIIEKDATQKANINDYIEKPWDINELISIIHATLKRKTERELYKNSKNDNLSDTLQVVRQAQEELIQNDGSINTVASKKIVFEFDSAREFNNFSYKISVLKNVSIDDVYTFENKYIIMITVYPMKFIKRANDNINLKNKFNDAE